ncbi:hypothetical protein ES332_A05G204800v1 [Gossypium tomentosum]|uniref:Purple acid phosphatase n=1 Tax=Gossypium tomentosum TaxID=34277 RepID=A0A5D2QID6_GOSTO|nr:hypothetical protein ES332_A05G204800v1 [Gossypium tomentosum]
MVAARWNCFSFQLVIAISFIFIIAEVCNRGRTSSFVRNSDLSRDMPLDSDVFRVPPGYNAPQQVHITQGDHLGNAVIVSWVTPDEPGSNSVFYWAENSELKKQCTRHCSYLQVLQLHFWFHSPLHHQGFGGDLGQTHDSNSTLTHNELNPAKGQTLLFLGDLSYADAYPFHDNARWDTWGRFIERNAAYQPWIWTAGNHEIDVVPAIREVIPFKPYTHRYHVPYTASGSTSPLWYSIKRASTYIIVLSSYSAYGTSTPQYKWLERELPKVNRTETPWLIVLMHSPFYNSYVHHYMEGESMRVSFEPWFVEYKVDVVFAGHVHAYERSERISNIAYNIVNGLCTPIKDPSAPVYLTIGDGGNLEGLVKEMTEPQPNYSAYREASFGHGILEIKNRTHAYFGWHRNQDGYAVEADSLWLHNRYWSVSDSEELSVATATI